MWYLSSKAVDMDCNMHATLAPLLALRNNQIRAIETHLVKTPQTKFTAPENDTRASRVHLCMDNTPDINNAC